MPRSEALKKAQILYRARHKDRIRIKCNVAGRIYQKAHYDDEAKAKKKEYYWKNKNYKDKTFHIDLRRLFQEN